MNDPLHKRLLPVTLGLITLFGTLFAVSGYVQSQVYRIERLEEADARTQNMLSAIAVQLKDLNIQIVELTVLLRGFQAQHQEIRRSLNREQR